MGLLLALSFMLCVPLSHEATSMSLRVLSREQRMAQDLTRGRWVADRDDL